MWNRELTWMGLCKPALETMGERFFLYRIEEEYRILFRPYIYTPPMIEKFSQLKINDLATEYFKYVSVYKHK